MAVGLWLAVGMAGGAVAAGQVAVVPVSGTVGGPPELVAFRGNVHIRSTLIKDPDFGKPPTVQLAIDLVDVIGKGLTSGDEHRARSLQTGPACPSSSAPTESPPLTLPPFAA